VRTGASIGIAIADGEGPHELVARADAAMYAEKRRRRAAR
jgi:GGDEF domain-containing protein